MKIISPQDAVNHNTAILIDVRDVSELKQYGKALGAIHIPLFLIPTQGDPNHPEFHPNLHIDTPVIVYCATGSRSTSAVRFLEDIGFKEVYNLGGLMHWQHGGGEVEAV